jgi:hypothetical protein
MSRRIAYSLRMGLLLAALASCKPASEAVASGKVAGKVTQAASTNTQQSGRLARIVFIDQEKCCACTRKRIDTSWKALSTVLGSKPSVPLDRYHLDTQEMQAEELLSKKPIMAAPGIYFLDKAGNLIELLQGEVTEAQIRAALAK